MQTSSNGDASSRRVVINFTYPSLFTDTTTSRVQIDKRLNFTLTGAVPVEMTDTDLNEAIAQGFNLLASTLIKQSASSGYAPT